VKFNQEWSMPGAGTWAGQVAATDLWNVAVGGDTDAVMVAVNELAMLPQELAVLDDLLVTVADAAVDLEIIQYLDVSDDLLTTIAEVTAPVEISEEIFKTASDDLAVTVDDRVRAQGHDIYVADNLLTTITEAQVYPQLQLSRTDALNVHLMETKLFCVEDWPEDLPVTGNWVEDAPIVPPPEGCRA